MKRLLVCLLLGACSDTVNFAYPDGLTLPVAGAPAPIICDATYPGVDWTHPRSGEYLNEYCKITVHAYYTPITRPLELEVQQVIADAQRLGGVEIARDVAPAGDYVTVTYLDPTASSAGSWTVVYLQADATGEFLTVVGTWPHGWNGDNRARDAAFAESVLKLWRALLTGSEP